MLLPLFLLLIIFLIPPSLSQSKLSVNTILQHSVNLSYTDSLLFNFPVSSPGILAVDWRSDPVPSGQSQIHGFPDLILSASTSNPLPAPITTPSRQDEPHHPFIHQCSPFNPCFITSDTLVTDHQAFFSNANRSFVSLRVPSDENQVFISIQNYPRGRAATHHEDQPPVPLKPSLKGLVTIRYIDFNSSDAICPGWTGIDCDFEPFPAVIFSKQVIFERVTNPECGQLCARRGKCSNSKCQCNSPDNHDGRFCESDIYPFPTPDPIVKPTTDSSSSSEDQADASKVPALPNAARISIKPSTTKLYRWTQDSFSSRVAIKVRVHTGIIRTVGNHPIDLNMSNTIVFINVKTPSENGSIFLHPPTILPGPYDELTTPQLTSNTSSRKAVDFYKQTALVGPNQAVFIAITANASAIPQHVQPKDAILFLAAFPCNETDDEDRDLPKCPTRDQFRFIIPLAILPICLVTIGLTLIALFAMLWFDRRHGFTNSVDRLSHKELARMYPAYKHQQASQTDRSEIPDPTATEDCTICLSQFDDSDLLRRLQCEHTFHAECIDPWLTQNNATCPTCRAECRIEQFSDNRQLRKLVIFCLGPIVYVRNLRQRRNANLIDEEVADGANSDSLDGADVETGSSRRHPSSNLDGSATRTLMPMIRIRFPSDIESNESSTTTFLSAVEHPCSDSDQVSSLDAQ